MCINESFFFCFRIYLPLSMRSTRTTLSERNGPALIAPLGNTKQHGQNVPRADESGKENRVVSALAEMLSQAENQTSTSIIEMVSSSSDNLGSLELTTVDGFNVFL